MAFISKNSGSKLMSQGFSKKLKLLSMCIFIISLGFACSGSDSGSMRGDGANDSIEADKIKNLPKDGGPIDDGGIYGDGPPNLNLGCTDDEEKKASLLNRRIRRLSSTQINNILKQALGNENFSGDLGADQEAYYQLSSNANLMIDDFNISNLSVLAAQVADAIEANANNAHFEALFNCTQQAKLTSDVCVQNFIASFGKILFRRNLNASEVNKYKTFYSTNSFNNPVLSFKAMIETMVNSPAFIYQSEFGDLTATGGAATTLNSAELASIISLAITDKGPDDTLLALVENDTLKNPEILSEQVKRLLDKKENEKPSTSAQYFSDFVFDWLNIELPPIEEKADYDALGIKKKEHTKAELAASMIRELRDLTLNVIEVKNANFDHLFNYKESYINLSLARIYGVPLTGLTTNKYVLKPLPEDKRHGILTSAAFLANYSMPTATTHILRGQVINEVALCHDQIEFADDPMVGDLDNPPLPDDDKSKTERENFQVHSLNPCAGCHVKLDPPGWALGNYDIFGKFQTNDMPSNKPIDATGEMLLTHGRKFSFTNGVDFAQKVAKTEDLPLCFTDRMVRHIYGSETYSGSRCEVKTQAKKFVDTNKNIENLITSIMSSEYFLKRNAK